MANRYFMVMLVTFLLTACSSDSQHKNIEQDLTMGSFALPIRCEQEGKLAPCLADVLKPGLRVIMLRTAGSGTCEAETAGTRIEDHAGSELVITLLNDSEKCSGTYRIAFLPKNNEPVHLTQLTVPESTMQSDIDTEAKKLLQKTFFECSNCDKSFLSQAKLNTSFAEGYTLLVYTRKDTTEGGPGVLFFNGKPFILKGVCTEGHIFFRVNGKLHITYVQCGNDSGVYIVHVYDLSSPQPKHVYENGELSV